MTNPLEIKKLKLAYKNMISRCYDPKNVSYHRYGGRGIQVCEEWIKSRESFISWSLKNMHGIKLSIDRIDNNGNYSPENCRWADIKTQLRNQNRNRLIAYQGKTQTVAAWAEELGHKQDTIHKRMERDLPLDKVLKVGMLRSWNHGSRAGYELHKCKCDLCRAANAARHKEQRLKRKLKKEQVNGTKK
jgi:hypothetical protein